MYKHKKTFISFVVDSLTAHYYQAELLLLSLEHFALHPKENIIVQCTNSVNQEFLTYLNNNGYSYNIINKYLYGKFCNKIQQLDFFNNDTILSDTDVILVDTDTFFLEPIKITDTNKFFGKIVDGPNPDLETIRNIFETARISLPHIVKADWKTDNGDTIATNFNGGFYFIPSKCINTINIAWKKWSQWLFTKAHVFNDPRVFVHLDQLSMALALSEIQLDYSNLATNFNCPVHRNNTQRYYQNNYPITLIHYHKEINSFGIINHDKSANKKIEKAIQRANKKIIEKCSFVFLEQFKRSLIQSPIFTNKSKKIETKISILLKDKRKLKLIIHCGTPKTGTTSLQFFLDKQRDPLKNIGFLYPLPNSNTYEPKHQWLTQSLLQDDAELLIDNFEKILEQTDNETHTIILSTEGIYNHWYDYKPEAKSFFVILKKLFDLEMIICFRRHTEFAYSLYAQYIKNPRMELVNCYGKDLSLTDMLNDNWFLKHLDYLSFIFEIEALIGKRHIKVYKYSNSLSIKFFFNKLNIELEYHDEIKENSKLCYDSIEILRIINKANLNPRIKNECLNLVKKIDRIISPYSVEKNLTKQETNLINNLSSIDSNLLETRYGLTF